jgi:predicted SprT family Zn-dependent metalloprotease
VRDIILHETAHAFCGPHVGHAVIWKRIARQIEAKPEITYDLRRVNVPPAKYIAHCPNRGNKRKVDSRRLVSCGRCDNKFNPAYLIVYRRNPQAIARTTR